MALKTWVSGTTYDDHIGTTAYQGGNSNFTAAGVTSAGFTAPNLVNKVTGVWVFFHIVPTTVNAIIDIQESTVTKVSATINNADIKIGWNYVRFGTPYQFATLTASAYRVKAYSSGGTSGSIMSAGSTTTLTTTVTYDTATTLAAGDKVWVGGFNDSGRTSKTLTITGTLATTIGDNTGTAMSNGFLGSIDAALTIGAGGAVVLDKTSSSTITVAGSITTYGDGYYDGGSSTSNSAIINTTIFDNSVNGSWGIMQAAQGRGGQYLFDGYEYDVYSTYASGVGTAANPMILSTAVNWTVGCEIVIGSSGVHTENEVRYIKTVNSTTSFVLSTTPGGAEAALTYTHAAGVHVANLTKNCVVKPVSTVLGYKAYIQHSSVTCQFENMRFEYSSAASAHGLNLEYLTGATAASTVNNVVFYGNSVGTRGTLAYQSIIATKTTTGCVFYNGLNSNLANGAVNVASAINQTFTDCFFFNAPGGTTCGQAIGLSVSANSNIFNNCHTYGMNASNTSTIGAVGISASNNNVFNNCSFNSSRQQGLYITSGIANKFYNCLFANRYTNVIDVFAVSSTYNSALFSNCTFGSATLISNYLNSVDGSEYLFHKYQQTAHKHRWYTNRGYAQATGTSLEDTTVRTAGSYNIKINPENNVGGFVWEFTVKSIVDQIAFLKAYLRKNTTMGTSVAKVEIFMPGTDTTGTADAIFTASNTTGTWQDFVIGKLYSGTENTEALIRITAISATAGAAIYLADFFDGVDALNSWFEAKPTKVVAPTDFTAVAGLLWSYPDTNTTSGTMGRRQVDAADSAELASIK